MPIRFNHQVLIGSHVFGEGEVVEADEKLTRFALENGHAVEHVETKPAVREAVSPAPVQARKATKRA
jgi:hypothetical protein